MFRWKNEIGIEGKLQFRVSLIWIFVLGGATEHKSHASLWCLLLSCILAMQFWDALMSFQEWCRAGDWFLAVQSRVDAHPWELSERQVSLPWTCLCCAGPFSAWYPAGAQGYFFSPLLCLPAKGQCRLCQHWAAPNWHQGSTKRCPLLVSPCCHLQYFFRGWPAGLRTKPLSLQLPGWLCTLSLIATIWGW